MPHFVAVSFTAADVLNGAMTAHAVSQYGIATPVVDDMDDDMFDLDRSDRTEARVVAVDGQLFYDGTLETAPVAPGELLLPTGGNLEDGAPKVVSITRLTTLLTLAAIVAATMPTVVAPALWSERTAPNTPS